MSEDKDDQPKDGVELLKIEHHRSPHFVSTFANGSIMSFSPTGLFNITFYEDVMGVNHELVNQETNDVTFDDDAIGHHREDKVRISMRESDMLALYSMLRRRFEPEDKDSD